MKFASFTKANRLHSNSLSLYVLSVTLFLCISSLINSRK